MTKVTVITGDQNEDWENCWDNCLQHIVLRLLDITGTLPPERSFLFQGFISEDPGKKLGDGTHPAMVLRIYVVDEVTEKIEMRRGTNNARAKILGKVDFHLYLYDDPDRAGCFASENVERDSICGNTHNLVRWVADRARSILMAHLA